jgi:hypothetical protein
MSKSKHTPGPWHISKYGSICKPDGTAFATMTSTSSEELRANRQLMVSAPDLLEAAIAALKCMEENTPNTTFAPRLLLRKAIAAAKGEA